MTLGLIALRAAKEQLVAAIATIKDELKNPELAEQIKFEVYNLGSDFDDHLTELGNAMPRMFKDKTAQVERSNVEGGLHLLDPTQENGLIAPGTEGNPALEVPGENEASSSNVARIGREAGITEQWPAPSNIQDAEAAGSPSAEDLDKVAEEKKAEIATGERIEGLAEKIKAALA